MRGDARFVRFQGSQVGPRGIRTGVFGLVNLLANAGLLTAEQDTFRRAANAWYDHKLTDPSDVVEGVYCHRTNPGVTAWFRADAHELIERVAGYLQILDTQGVPYEVARSVSPGRVIYEDADQVVVVPRASANCPTCSPGGSGAPVALSAAAQVQLARGSREGSGAARCGADSLSV